jgi:hypothetical protein
MEANFPEAGRMALRSGCDHMSCVLRRLTGFADVTHQVLRFRELTEGWIIGAAQQPRGYRRLYALPRPPP